MGVRSLSLTTKCFPKNILLILKMRSMKVRGTRWLTCSYSWWQNWTCILSAHCYIGWLHGCTTCVVAQGPPSPHLDSSALGLMFCYHNLEVLNTFQMRRLAFHFVLGPTDHVMMPPTQLSQPYKPYCFLIPFYVHIKNFSHLCTLIFEKVIV